MNKHKGKIAFLILLAAVLIFAYLRGGNIPPQKEGNLPAVSEEITQNKENEKNDSAEIITKEEVQPPKEIDEILIEEEKESAAQETPPNNIDYSTQQGMIIDKETGMDKYNTQPVPEGKPVPIEPQTVTISNKQLSCTLSVCCDTLLNNSEWLDSEKVELVPLDGVIFAEREVIFYEGESVFNLLLREMKRNKIHMEYSNTPIYNSVYIEGINNLYEFDCGELSGWMYKVNGWFPNYGCSRYQLKQGDRVEWVYTCDLGKDVGEIQNK